MLRVSKHNKIELGSHSLLINKMQFFPDDDWSQIICKNVLLFYNQINNLENGRIKIFLFSGTKNLDTKLHVSNHY